jgi:hypothetical protein
MNRSREPVIRRVLVIASLVIACVTIGGLSVSSNAAGGGHDSVRWRPWWRFPVIHTTQELIFLRWMDHRYGAGWLRFMTDEQILREWRWFVYFGPRF